jgi:hypothetical protein
MAIFLLYLRLSGGGYGGDAGALLSHLGRRLAGNPQHRGGGTAAGYRERRV